MSGRHVITGRKSAIAPAPHRRRRARLSAGLQCTKRQSHGRAGSRKHRSWNMSRIRGKNTKPEKLIRSALHRIGYRFRLHVKNLPGRPDIVLRRFRTIVFVHGCFWHRHKQCSKCTTPTERRDFWLAKLTGNAERDIRHRRKLSRSKWRVVTIWECRVERPNGPDRQAAKIQQVLKKQEQRLQRLSSSSVTKKTIG